MGYVKMWTGAFEKWRNEQLITCIWGFSLHEAFTLPLLYPEWELGGEDAFHIGLFIHRGGSSLKMKTEYQITEDCQQSIWITWGLILLPTASMEVVPLTPLEAGLSPQRPFCQQGPSLCWAHSIFTAVRIMPLRLQAETLGYPFIWYSAGKSFQGDSIIKWVRALPVP